MLGANKIHVDISDITEVHNNKHKHKIRVNKANDISDTVDNENGKQEMESSSSSQVGQSYL